MFLRKLGKVGKRLVWRMSSAHPAGVYLTSKGNEPRSGAPAEACERDFRGSAFELSSGAEVIETAMDALPSELIAQFTRARS
jgi:hypothetical protein